MNLRLNFQVEFPLLTDEMSLSKKKTTPFFYLNLSNLMATSLFVYFRRSAVQTNDTAWTVVGLGYTHSLLSQYCLLYTSDAADE